MKTKLLRKLRSKFYIVRNPYGRYLVEGSVESSRWDWTSVDKAREYRRDIILKHARYHFSSYSVWYRRRLN